MKYLTLLFLLLVTPVFADGPDLLKKQPDGSVEINVQNAFALARGLCPHFDPLLNTDESIANTIWGNQLGVISDNFARHAALEQYVAALDDVTARAKTVTQVTFTFGVGIGDYDFSKKAFPFGPIWCCTAPRTLGGTGGVNVGFTQRLATDIPVPDEDTARLLQTCITNYRHHLVAVVHGTLVRADQAHHNIPPLPPFDPAKPETEAFDFANYRLLVAPTAVDFRLGDAKGPTLCTQTFGTTPSLSPLVIPTNPSPSP